MRARRRTVLVGLLGAVLVTAGCAAAPPPSPFPPRPKNLDLANVDLCATLTAAQKQQRGIDRDRASIATTTDGRQAPTCSWTDDESGTSYAVQVFQGSAAEMLQTPGSRVSEISGFGTVRGPNDNPDRRPGAVASCQIPVDASDSQSLRVQYDTERGDAGNPAEQAAACGEATRLAEDVLANLTR